MRGPGAPPSSSTQGPLGPGVQGIPIDPAVPPMPGSVQGPLGTSTPRPRSVPPRGRGPVIFSPGFTVSTAGEAGLTERLKQQQALNDYLSSSLTELRDGQQTLHARLVGADTDHRALVTNSQRVVGEVVTEARREFYNHDQAVAELKSAMAGRVSSA